jgi:8-oxo-dGTP diphosphatase
MDRPAGRPDADRGDRLASALVTIPVPMHPVDVLLLLTEGEHVLLALREGTGYADGQWNLPSGKLEHGEDAVSAVIREAREEIGVRLDPGEPRMVATVHHRNTAGFARVGLVFTVAYDPARHREPINAEPHKCAKIEWFPADMPPSNTYPYTAECVRAFRDGQPFALSGWR